MQSFRMIYLPAPGQNPRSLPLQGPLEVALAVASKIARVQHWTLLTVKQERPK